jgi:hypothetical protein
LLFRNDPIELSVDSLKLRTYELLPIRMADRGANKWFSARAGSFAAISGFSPYFANGHHRYISVLLFVQQINQCMIVGGKDRGSG